MTDDPHNSGPGDPQAFLDYTNTADKLADIIADLIPKHPEILTMKSVFDLFKVDGFREAIDGLTPSLAQANWAWSVAVKRHENL